MALRTYRGSKLRSQVLRLNDKEIDKIAELVWAEPELAKAIVNQSIRYLTQSQAEKLTAAFAWSNTRSMYNKLKHYYP